MLPPLLFILILKVLDSTIRKVKEEKRRKIRKQETELWQLIDNIIKYTTTENPNRRKISYLRVGEDFKKRIQSIFNRKETVNKFDYIKILSKTPCHASIKYTIKSIEYPEHKSRKDENSNFKKYIHPNVDSSTINSSKNMDAT